MNILVTGSNGFIGKHILFHLNRLGYVTFPYDINNSEEELFNYIKKSDFVINVAGVNRPKDNEDFYISNTNFTSKLVSLIKKAHKNIPILLSSSIQATLDNEYGRSKLEAENILFNSGLPVYVFRLNNIFGKWCRPNYNSVVATFCYNIAHDLDVYVRDKNYIVHFNYIDDVVDEFIKCINSDLKGSKDILSVTPIYDCSLGHLEELLRYFKKEIESDRHLPIIHNEFEYKLFKTFCNYLTEIESLNYSSDNRGSFIELYKSNKYGQISENIILPGITKGGHYHKYKKEIFYTVIGSSEIIQRNIINNDITKDVVDGNEPRLVNIIPNYIHSITNIGKNNSHTLMWISKVYDENKPDTYRE